MANISLGVNGALPLWRDRKGAAFHLLHKLGNFHYFR